MFIRRKIYRKERTMQEVEISYIGIKQDINHEKLIKTVIETCMKEEKLNNLNYYGTRKDTQASA